MDLLEGLENQGCLERLEDKVHQEPQECLVQRVQTDQEVHLVTEDLLEELECQALKDQKDQLEQMVLQDLPDPLDQMEHQEIVEYLDFQDLQVLLDQEVPKEQEVKEEKKVHLVNRGLLVLVEDQETRGHQGLLVQW